MGIGSRIRTERKTQGLTQEELARRAGVSLNIVNRLERGETTDPHYSTLVSITDALGMSISDLQEETVPLDEASETGPPQVSREVLLAQGITVNDLELEELNDTLMSLWRLGQGEKVVARVGHEVDTERVFMLVHLVLDTPGVVRPPAAGVLNQGMRAKLKAV